MCKISGVLSRPNYGMQKKEKEKKYFMNKNLLKIFALRRARIPFCISVSFLFSEINILSQNVWNKLIARLLNF